MELIYLQCLQYSLNHKVFFPLFFLNICGILYFSRVSHSASIRSISSQCPQLHELKPAYEGVSEVNRCQVRCERGGMIEQVLATEVGVREVQQALKVDTQP